MSIFTPTPANPNSNSNPNSKSEADIILNRTNVALARSQRLVASWLPPKQSTTTTSDEHNRDKNEEEEARLQREEDEIFTPVPERLGLGAPLPQKEQEKQENRTDLDSTEKLRKQLLGRNYEKFMKEKEKERKKKEKSSAPSSSASASASASTSAMAAGHSDKRPSAGDTTAKGLGDTVNGHGDGDKVDEDEDEDEEDGRTAVVGRKRGGGRKDNGIGNDAARHAEGSSSLQGTGADGDSGKGKGGSAPSKGRKKATSFLDEVLAERSKKRKKK